MTLFPRHSYSLILTFFWMGISCSGPAIRIPIVEKMPPRFMKVMKGANNIGIILKKNRSPHPDTEWSEQMEGAVKQSVQNAGYFTLVNVENRKDRLDELSYSQSGMTANIQEIGRELSANGLLFVKVTATPRSECTQERKQVQEQICSRMDAKKNCLEYRTTIKTQTTGVLKVYVGMAGELVNVETGESLSYSHNQTDTYHNSDGNSACPSRLESINQSIVSTADVLAKNLSPIVTEHAVEIMDASDTIEHPKNDSISEKLKTGVNFIDMEDPDYELAEQNWNEAWRLSDRKCPEAAWNLAVLQWHNGNLEEAKSYFDKAFELGGKGWADDDLVKIYTTFKLEKKRIDAMEG